MRKLKTISKKDLKNIKGGKNDLIVDDIVISQRGIKNGDIVKSSYDLIVDDLVVMP